MGYKYLQTMLFRPDVLVFNPIKMCQKVVAGKSMCVLRLASTTA